VLGGPYFDRFPTLAANGFLPVPRFLQVARGKQQFKTRSASGLKAGKKREAKGSSGQLDAKVF